ncbi:MAG TPA: LemA family protein [Thermodesulfovibrionales bacterium]|nr:LemA family protein [Thermodesulfovibrionales bacterium]
MTIWIAVGIFVLILSWIIFTYNSLVFYKNEVQNAWKQIDVQLKRRHDLIPNLVSVVKGYMAYERDILERVISARAMALSSSGVRARAACESQLTQALQGLFAVMENYPVLKSVESVMELQEELKSTENKIAFSRQFYNDLVANLRTKIEVFPNNIIAGLFGFGKAEYYSAGEDDRLRPPAQTVNRP